METKSYTTIDRAKNGWPSGEWDNEPDKMQWPDEKTGLPCLAVRHTRSGNWCGYVGVAEGHPAYQVGYDEVRMGDEWPEVHGGLTFANMCRPSENESEGICHVPSAGEPDHVWWFGFDCAHAGDYSPQDVLYAQTRGYPFTQSPDEQYRTLDYVRRECASLAKQLASMDSKS